MLLLRAGKFYSKSWSAPVATRRLFTPITSLCLWKDLKFQLARLTLSPSGLALTRDIRWRHIKALAITKCHLLRAFGIAALSAIMVRRPRSKTGSTRPVSIRDMFRRVSRGTMERPVRFLDILLGFNCLHQSAKT